MARRTSFTRPELAMVGAAALLVFTRVFGLSVVLPNFRSYGATLTDNDVLVGTALGAYALTLALMQWPMGRLSDKWGRKPVLLGGTVLFVVGSIAAALAPTIETLIAARLVQGLGAVSSTAMAAVGETVPAERRTTAMALIGIPAGVGFMLGFIIGPVLAPSVGVAGLFWLTAAVGFASLVPIALLHFAPPTPAAPGPISVGVFSLAVAGFSSNYALTTVLFFLPTGDWRLLLPMFIGAFLIMGAASRRTDRAGWTWQPAAVGVVLLAIAAPLVATSTAWGLVAAGTLFFGAHAVLSATLPSQVSRLAGARGGSAHGVQNIVAYLGTFLAGPIAGYFASQMAGAFAILGGLAGATVALLIVGMRSHGNQQTTGGPEASY